MGNRKILVTVALPEEKFDIPESGDIKVVTTGVGKASAAYALTREIMKFRPDMVINAGTAGTVRLGVGDIVVPVGYCDRDLAPLAIEGVVSEISMEKALPLPSVVSGRESLGGFVVNTGDDFVTDLSGIAGDVIDMEGFAQAMVCRAENVPFVSVKYITDVIGQNSVKVWNEKLADARKALGGYFRKYILPQLCHLA